MSPFAATPVTPVTPATSRSSHRSRTALRLRALQQVILFGALFNVGLSIEAHAWVGGALLQFAQQNIIAPVGLIALVIAIGGALFRPEMVSKALYTTLICAVLFFVINQGSTVMAAFQS
jgi:hypothetical protein